MFYILKRNSIKFLFDQFHDLTFTMSSFIIMRSISGYVLFCSSVCITNFAHCIQIFCTEIYKRWCDFIQKLIVNIPFR